MLRTALAAAALTLLVACGSSSVSDSSSAADAGSTGDSAAQRVADFDGATDTAPYAAALDALSSCSDSRDQLASYAIFGSQDEAKHDITETALAVLGDIDTSRAGISDCKGVLAAYLTLREG